MIVNEKKDKAMDEKKALRRWNWGAMILSIPWCLWHKVWQGLFFFVPFINFVLPFYLGAKGNRLAWERSSKKDLERFLKSQRRWAIAALFFLLLIPIFLTSMGVFFYFHSEARDEELTKTLNSNAALVYELGYPIKLQESWSSSLLKILDGFNNPDSGKEVYYKDELKTQGAQKHSYQIRRVHGLKGSGILTLEKEIFHGTWMVTRLGLLKDSNDEEIILISSPNSFFSIEGHEQNISEEETFESFAKRALSEMLLSKDDEAFFLFERLYNEEKKEQEDLLSVNLGEPNKDGESESFEVYYLKNEGKDRKFFYKDFSVQDIDKIIQILLEYSKGSDLHRENYSWYEEIEKIKDPQHPENSFSRYSKKSQPRPFR